MPNNLCLLLVKHNVIPLVIPWRSPPTQLKIILFMHLSPRLFDIVSLIVLCVLCIIPHFITPHTPLIPLGKDNPTVGYPFVKDEEVPNMYLFIYAAGVPVIVITIWTTVKSFISTGKYTMQLGDGSKVEVVLPSPIWKIFDASLILGVCFTTALVFVQWSKVFVARPRPHYWSRKTIDPTTNDSSLSYPSAHSAMMFTGMGYLSLFFAGEMKVFLKPNLCRCLFQGMLG